MTDFRPSDTDQARSLRDRIFHIFRVSSSPSLVSRSGTPTDTMSRTGLAEGDSREVNTRTPLLRSYDRREPPCGLGDSCNHGTFTPRVTTDEHPGWRTTSMPEFGGERSRAFGNLSQQSTSGTPSVEGPENIPVTGGSPPPPVKHSKSMYVDGFGLLVPGSQRLIST
jgi:hypothetical protein